MASEGEASCLCDPNFAVICSFLEKFGKPCGITYPNFEKLQEMLENTNEVPQQLIDLHVKLLRKARKSVSNERWEKALIKFCHTYSNQDGWEIERFGYKKARLGVKLSLLKCLLEMQFDFNGRFKTEINRLNAEDLRLQPIGRDKLGQAYWSQLDEDCNLRVYREDLDDENWEIVAKDREGLLQLITQLSSNEPFNSELENLLNEDSNSQDIEKPITDTGQVENSSCSNDDEEGDKRGEVEVEEHKGVVTPERVMNGHELSEHTDSLRNKEEPEQNSNTISKCETMEQADELTKDKGLTGESQAQPSLSENVSENNSCTEKDKTIKPFKIDLSKQVQRNKTEMGLNLSKSVNLILNETNKKEVKISPSLSQKSDVINNSDNFSTRTTQENMNTMCNIGTSNIPYIKTVQEETNSVPLSNPSSVQNVATDLSMRHLPNVSIVPVTGSNDQLKAVRSNDKRGSSFSESVSSTVLKRTRWEESVVGEAIEEPLMLVRGEGSGVDCDTGNPEKKSESSGTVEKNTKNKSSLDSEHTEGLPGGSKDVNTKVPGSDLNCVTKSDDLCDKVLPTCSVNENSDGKSSLHNEEKLGQQEKHLPFPSDKVIQDKNAKDYVNIKLKRVHSVEGNNENVDQDGKKLDTASLELEKEVERTSSVFSDNNNFPSAVEDVSSLETLVHNNNNVVSSSTEPLARPTEAPLPATKRFLHLSTNARSKSSFDTPKSCLDTSPTKSERTPPKLWSIDNICGPNIDPPESTNVVPKTKDSGSNSTTNISPGIQLPRQKVRQSRWDVGKPPEGTPVSKPHDQPVSRYVGNIQKQTSPTACKSEGPMKYVSTLESDSQTSSESKPLEKSSDLNNPRQEQSDVCESIATKSLKKDESENNNESKVEKSQAPALASSQRFFFGPGCLQFSGVKTVPSLPTQGNTDTTLASQVQRDSSVHTTENAIKETNHPDTKSQNLLSVTGEQQKLTCQKDKSNSLKSPSQDPFNLQKSSITSNLLVPRTSTSESLENNNKIADQGLCQEKTKEKQDFQISHGNDTSLSTIKKASMDDVSEKSSVNDAGTCLEKKLNVESSSSESLASTSSLLPGNRINNELDMGCTIDKSTRKQSSDLTRGTEEACETKICVTQEIEDTKLSPARNEKQVDPSIDITQSSVKTSIDNSECQSNTVKKSDTNPPLQASKSHSSNEGNVLPAKTKGLLEDNIFPNPSDLPVNSSSRASPTTKVKDNSANHANENYVALSADKIELDSRNVKNVSASSLPLCNPISSNTNASNMNPVAPKNSIVECSVSDDSKQTMNTSQKSSGVSDDREKVMCLSKEDEKLDIESSSKVVCISQDSAESKHLDLSSTPTKESVDVKCPDNDNSSLGTTIGKHVSCSEIAKATKETISSKDSFKQIVQEVKQTETIPKDLVSVTSQEKSYKDTKLLNFNETPSLKEGSAETNPSSYSCTPLQASKEVARPINDNSKGSIRTLKELDKGNENKITKEVSVKAEHIQSSDPKRTEKLFETESINDLHQVTQQIVPMPTKSYPSKESTNEVPSMRATTASKLADESVHLERSIKKCTEKKEGSEAVRPSKQHHKIQPHHLHDTSTVTQSVNQIPANDAKVALAITHHHVKQESASNSQEIHLLEQPKPSDYSETILPTEHSVQQKPVNDSEVPLPHSQQTVQPKPTDDSMAVVQPTQKSVQPKSTDCSKALTKLLDNSKTMLPLQQSVEPVNVDNCKSVPQSTQQSVRAQPTVDLEASPSQSSAQKVSKTNPIRNSKEMLLPTKNLSQEQRIETLPPSQDAVKPASLNDSTTSLGIMELPFPAQQSENSSGTLTPVQEMESMHLKDLGTASPPQGSIKSNLPENVKEKHSPTKQPVTLTSVKLNEPKIIAKDSLKTPSLQTPIKSKSTENPGTEHLIKTNVCVSSRSVLDKKKGSDSDPDATKASNELTNQGLELEHSKETSGKLSQTNTTEVSDIGTMSQEQLPTIVKTTSKAHDEKTENRNLVVTDNKQHPFNALLQDHTPTKANVSTVENASEQKTVKPEIKPLDVCTMIKETSASEQKIIKPKIKPVDVSTMNKETSASEQKTVKSSEIKPTHVSTMSKETSASEQKTVKPSKIKPVDVSTMNKETSASEQKTVKPSKIKPEAVSTMSKETSVSEQKTVKPSEIKPVDVSTMSKETSASEQKTVKPSEIKPVDFSTMSKETSASEQKTVKPSKIKPVDVSTMNKETSASEQKTVKPSKIKPEVVSTMSKETSASEQKTVKPSEIKPVDVSTMSKETSASEQKTVKPSEIKPVDFSTMSKETSASEQKTVKPSEIKPVDVSTMSKETSASDQKTVKPSKIKPVDVSTMNKETSASEQKTVKPSEIKPVDLSTMSKETSASEQKTVKPSKIKPVDVSTMNKETSASEQKTVKPSEIKPVDLSTMSKETSASEQKTVKPSKIKPVDVSTMNKETSASEQKTVKPSEIKPVDVSTMSKETSASEQKTVKPSKIKPVDVSTMNKETSASEQKTVKPSEIKPVDVSTMSKETSASEQKTVKPSKIKPVDVSTMNKETSASEQKTVKPSEIKPEAVSTMSKETSASEQKTVKPSEIKPVAVSTVNKETSASEQKTVKPSEIKPVAVSTVNKETSASEQKTVKPSELKPVSVSTMNKETSAELADIKPAKDLANVVPVKDSDKINCPDDKSKVTKEVSSIPPTSNTKVFSEVRSTVSNDMTTSETSVNNPSIELVSKNSTRNKVPGKGSQDGSELLSNKQIKQLSGIESAVPDNSHTVLSKLSSSNELVDIPIDERYVANLTNVALLDTKIAHLTDTKEVSNQGEEFKSIKLSPKSVKSSTQMENDNIVHKSLEHEANVNSSQDMSTVSKKSDVKDTLLNKEGAYQKFTKKETLLEFDTEPSPLALGSSAPGSNIIIKEAADANSGTRTVSPKSSDQSNRNILSKDSLPITPPKIAAGIVTKDCSVVLKSISKKTLLLSKETSLHTPKNKPMSTECRSEEVSPVLVSEKKSSRVSSKEELAKSEDAANAVIPSNVIKLRPIESLLEAKTSVHVSKVEESAKNTQSVSPGDTSHKKLPLSKSALPESMDEISNKEKSVTKEISSTPLMLTSSESITNKPTYSESVKLTLISEGGDTLSPMNTTNKPVPVAGTDISIKELSSTISLQVTADSGGSTDKPLVEQSNISSNEEVTGADSSDLSVKEEQNTVREPVEASSSKLSQTGESNKLTPVISVRTDLSVETFKTNDKPGLEGGSQKVVTSKVKNSEEKMEECTDSPVEIVQTRRQGRVKKTTSTDSETKTEVKSEIKPEQSILGLSMDYNPTEDMPKIITRSKEYGKTTRNRAKVKKTETMMEGDKVALGETEPVEDFEDLIPVTVTRSRRSGASLPPPPVTRKRRSIESAADEGGKRAKRGKEVISEDEVVEEQLLSKRKGRGRPPKAGKIQTPTPKVKRGYNRRVSSPESTDKDTQSHKMVENKQSKGPGRRSRGRRKLVQEAKESSSEGDDIGVDIACGVSSEENVPESVKKKTPLKPKPAPKKTRRVLGLEVPVDLDLDQANAGLPPMRQSRRIAQIKIKEEAERRELEEMTLSALKSEQWEKKKKEKQGEKKKKKKVSDGCSAEEEEPDVEFTIAKKKKKKKRKRDKKWTHTSFDESKAWQSSSDSSSSQEEEEEDLGDHSEDEERIINTVLKSDHEFSPESDLEAEDEAWAPTRLARTAQKVVVDTGEEDAVDDAACQKCNASDHPEWILLCDKCDSGWHASCLRPALFIIPEGDWYCPPCQHTALIFRLHEQLREVDRTAKRRDNEELRKKRLAYVGISLDNVLPKDTKEEGPGSHDESGRESGAGDNSSSESSGSGSRSSDESEPIYQLRVRRTTVFSYRFNEYDDLINSAIQDEIEAVKGAGNQGRGKDIATIVNAEKEEFDREQAEETDEKTKEEVELDGEKDEEEEEGENDDEEEEENYIPPVKKLFIKKKHRKLNSLDISSEDDPESDEDFKGSSSDHEEEYEEDADSDDSEMHGRRRRGASGPVRRSSRARTTRFDKEFIDDDSDDSDIPRSRSKKKSRHIWDDTSDSEESDSTWGQAPKRPKQAPRTHAPREIKKKRGKKKKKRVAAAAAAGSDIEVYKASKPKKPRVKFGGLDENEDVFTVRRTRGCKMNYVETGDTDSDDEKFFRPSQTKKLDSDEEDEYVINEEEMTEMDEEEVEAEEEEEELKDSENESGDDGHIPDPELELEPEPEVEPEQVHDPALVAEPIQPFSEAQGKINKAKDTIGGKRSKNIKKVDPLIISAAALGKESEEPKALSVVEEQQEEQLVNEEQLVKEQKRLKKEVKKLEKKEQKKKGKRKKSDLESEEMITSPVSSTEVPTPIEMLSNEITPTIPASGITSLLDSAAKKKIRGRGKATVPKAATPEVAGGPQGFPNTSSPSQGNSVISRLLQSQPVSGAHSFADATSAMGQKYFGDQLLPPGIRGMTPNTRPPFMAMRGRHPSPYRQPRSPGGVPSYPGPRPSRPPTATQMYHTSHHPLDPSPSGGGPIAIAADSTPPKHSHGTPPPPYSRSGPPSMMGRFTTDVSPPSGGSPLRLPASHFSPTTQANASPGRSPAPGNFTNYHSTPNYHYGTYPVGTEDALPPAAYQTSSYPETYTSSPLHTSESSNSKPIDEEGSGEFGGLVSYFSSQREDDLDA